MDNSGNSSGQNFATESNSSAKSKSDQNLVPVMIGHLIRYGEDLKIWGVPAKMITFVAIVDEIEIKSPKVNFKFRDETGTIKGVKYFDIEAYECPVKIRTYARVFGRMRKYDNENFVLVFNIQPMGHLNELLLHLMEVTAMCLEGEKLATQAAQNHSTNNNTSTTNHHSAGPSTTNSANGNLNYEQNLIMDIIARDHPEDGAERSAIRCQVPHHLAPKVDAILEFLSAEGHIYTTKTDDHFKKI